jgi:tetratricopeptide (TPR) repeat protein
LQLRNYDVPHLLRAETLLARGESEKAIAAFDDYFLTTKTAPRPGAYRERALAKAKLRRYQSAVEDYTLALKVYAEQRDRRQESYTLVGRGWAHLGNKDPRRALADFEQAVQADGSNGYAYNGRAYARLKSDLTRGHLADAQAAARDAEEGLQLLKGAPPQGLLLNSARVYAQACARAEEASRGRDPAAAALLARYEARALRLLGQALATEPGVEARGRFWADHVVNDPDFRPLHNNRDFRLLDQEFTSRR